MEDSIGMIGIRQILRGMLAAALLISGAACGIGSGGAAVEKWGGDIDATYSEAQPEDASSVALAPGTMQAGKTADGGNVYALMRFNIGTAWLQSEMKDARLFLKVLGETQPKRLRIAPIEGTWDSYFTTLAEIKAMIDTGGAIAADVRAEQDGFISVPLTDCVRTWMGGGMYNNGVAVFGEADGETYTFAAIVGGDDEAAQPYIAASGEIGGRDLSYGKYGFAETADTEIGGEGGNCMSYALRDTDMILADDLGLDRGEMARIYSQAAPGAGTDALADYTAQCVLDYVQAHKDTLEISQIRQIDGFDSEIDASEQYRIALRVGANVFGGTADFSDDRSFDYHFWAQLDDGRWAQKFPTGKSMIIPCTGPGISPGKYPWDSGYERTPKSADFYTSKTVYFAVTKDTGDLTHHRG
ncbi:MAG: DNRLRE domain-containing protein [Oscillospiraceae bacterium]|jgi:hypothetical protein|nr:DNRLRE domain-containing protein [Oscillospiraceae bacterium]